MTDADLLPRSRASWRAFRDARLQLTTHTRARLHGHQLEAPYLVAANTSRLDCVGGRGWLAAGDAAAAFDPLSSQGLRQALDSGCRAGEAVSRQLDGENDAIGEYERGTTQVFRDYVRLHALYYGRERRWPQSVFWRRRHAVGPRAARGA